jgi:hypothetical protein
MLRALVDSDIPGRVDRVDSEIRLRECLPLIELGSDDEEPTGRFQRTSPPPSSPADSSPDSSADLEPLSARGVARLSALADWLDGETTSGVVVGLVRAFLDDLDDVRVALAALVDATPDSSVAPGLDAAVQSLAHAVGLWRMKLIEHVDDLAISDHHSLAGWSSLPEYSAAYTLAFLRPALAEAEVSASVKRGETGDVTALVGALGIRIRRLNATLRAAVDSAPAARSQVGSGLAVTTW